MGENQTQNYFIFVTYQTKNGSINCITITIPRVTNINPRFSNNIRQHMPLILGQKGFGAAIVSTVTPPLRDVLVFVVLAMDGATPLL